MKQPILFNRFLNTIPWIIVLLSVFSCSGGLEEKLIGKWKGSDHLFVRTGGPDVVVTIDGGLERHLVSSLILNEDGTYEEFVGEYDNGTGVWFVEDKALILKNSSGNEVSYQLLKITDDELITRRELTMKTPEGELSGEITLTYQR